MKHKLFYTLLQLIIFSMFILMTGCSKAPSDIPLATGTSLAFDTIISISVYENTSGNTLTKKDAELVIDQVNSLCAEYENMLSKTIKGSDIDQINHADGQPVCVHPETFMLIKESIKYSEKTNGLIDITVSGAKDLWDFSTQDENAASTAIPSDSKIQKALKHVDYQMIILDETNYTVTLSDPDAQIDLGFIAKGYIADKIKEYLIENDIENAIINLGGNVLTLGQKPSGQAFIVGIEKPFDKETFIDKIPVSGRSVVTSGIYERYFKVDDTLYHHIIDSKTGYPVDTDLLSATIIADTSMQADALSTTCILLGKEKAMEYLINQPDVSAILVTNDYEIIKINFNENEQ
ncbi:MAG: FAD:protein FMN transferase [Lachnospiraceae bacterium]